jgi:hypothetical protein
MVGFRFPGPLCVTKAPMIDEGTLCRATSPLPGPLNFIAGSPAAAFNDDAIEDGVEMVLTPVQMAAIFENGTIESEGTLGNRLWGGLSIIGGALEMVGAGVLLLTPEPTTATKVGGGALGLHGLDTAGAGIRQVISGKSESSYTAEGAKAAAIALGADEKTAGQIGMSVRHRRATSPGPVRRGARCSNPQRGNQPSGGRGGRGAHDAEACRANRGATQSPLSS